MTNANPGVEKRYALDFLSVVRHVATELDGAAPAALSVSDMASTYRHPVPTDLSRVRHHHDIGSDSEAIKFLIERAVIALTHRGKTERSKRQINSDGNGGYSLAVDDMDELRYEDERVYRVTETDDADEKRSLRAVYNDLANERVFYVSVEGARGGMQERQYELHPLARAIPQVTEKEFLELADDIKRNGVELPIIVYDGQVLDGRHRLAIASALKIALRVTEVEGDEARARARVMSLNVSRRHLTTAQRALIVRELFLPEAREKAKERQERGLSADGRAGGRGKTLAQNGAKVSDSVKAAEIAVKESGGLASVRSVEALAPIDNAPRARERITKAEIKNVAEGRREAEKELGIEPTRPPVAQPRSAWDRLGCARGDVESAADSIENGFTGNVSTDNIRDRIAEIRQHLDRAEKQLDGRDG